MPTHTLPHSQQNESAGKKIPHQVRQFIIEYGGLLTMGIGIFFFLAWMLSIPLAIKPSPTTTSAAPPPATNGLTISQGTIYDTNTSIYAYRRQITPHWHTGILQQHHLRALSNSPAIDNGIMYLQTTATDSTTTSQTNVAVSAIRISDEKLLWQHQLNGGETNQPVVINGIVYTEGKQTNRPTALFALRETDGMLLWSYQAQNSTEHIHSPLIIGQMLYLSTDTPQELYAFNSSNGHLSWQSKIPGTNISVTAPTFSQQTIAVGSGNDIYGFNATTGTLSWQKQVASGTITAIGSDDTDFITETNQGSIYALTATDGFLIWRSDIGDHGGTSLIVTNDTIYVALTEMSQSSPYVDASYIVALGTQDGIQTWQYNTGTQRLPSFLLDNNYLYVAPSTNTLVALQTDTGQVSWQTTIN